MIRLSGFTFIKSGLDLGYPFMESIKSLMPFCDEIIINVGFATPSLDHDDGTYELISKTFTGPQFKIIKSYWDPAIHSKGLILSHQTDLALAECQGEYCQYLQGDEVIHEDDIPLIKAALDAMDANKALEGATFDYHHFYGNVDVLKYSRNVYRREVRLIRNKIGIKSYLDAQGFKTKDGEKLNCLRGKARIFHYGWARESNTMAKKVSSFGKLYHGPSHSDDGFHYSRIWGLKKFSGTHPSVMSSWIETNRNSTNILSLPYELKLSDMGLIISDTIEKITGWRLGEYRNYRIAQKL